MARLYGGEAAGKTLSPRPINGLSAEVAKRVKDKCDILKQLSIDRWCHFYVCDCRRNHSQREKLFTNGGNCWECGNYARARKKIDARTDDRRWFNRKSSISNGCNRNH